MHQLDGISRRVALSRLVALQLCGLGCGSATLAQQSEIDAQIPWPQRLSRSDHFLLMRHALAPGVGDPTDFKHGKCHTQRNLNEQGRAQAQQIGSWLRSRGLHTAQVFSSPWCRCVDTAQGLGLGPVMVEAALGSFFGTPDQKSQQTMALQARITKLLAKKGVTPLVLISHHVNIEAYTGLILGSGEMVVVQVDSNGRPVLTERIYGL